MKVTALLIAASVASTSAFAPQPQTKASTQLNESLFKKLSNMDLFEPNKTQNDYGARAGKKSTGVAKLNDNSYVPFGLTKAQYEKIRSDEVAKKAANYDRNVKKAFKFQDYTDVSFVCCFLLSLLYERSRDTTGMFFYRVFLYDSNHILRCSSINNFIMSNFLLILVLHKAWFR